MNALTEFIDRLRAGARTTFESLDQPPAIQAYLDSLPYVAEELDRSPKRVLEDGQAHCLDGGLFAALALQRLGFPARVLDLVPARGLDDDHVLALYRVAGCWGAVAKSNYAWLRFREPVYRSLRELAMSYFEPYFNADRVKSLRAYTRPLDLRRFDASGWMWDEAGVAAVSRSLYALRATPLLTADQAARLSIADERSFAANTQGTDFAWVYGVRDNP
ncbi:MAG: hypothetical protein JXB85_01285 [Anaerolineales bacterium]|nr:hypothetical protein [Anaerolineales bacterium]